MGGPEFDQNTVYDIFVGNIPFNTTQEEIHSIFSQVGPVARVRLQLKEDDPSKHKGIAFIDFFDPKVALLAIRTMNGKEVNNRKIRVSFSNNQTLKDMAEKAGFDVESHQNRKSALVRKMHLHTCHQIISYIRSVALRNPKELASFLVRNPSLMPAVSDMMVKLGMKKMTEEDRARQKREEKEDEEDDEEGGGSGQKRGLYDTSAFSYEGSSATKRQRTDDRYGGSQGGYGSSSSSSSSGSGYMDGRGGGGGYYQQQQAPTFDYSRGGGQQQSHYQHHQGHHQHHQQGHHHQSQNQQHHQSHSSSYDYSRREGRSRFG